MSLTTTEIDSIRRRADAATQGPWTPQNWGVNNAFQEITIASFIETEEDTQFIAHAREDIPELLTEIYRQREEIESLTRCPETCAYIDRLADQLSAVTKERDSALSYLHGSCFACTNYSAFHNQGKCKDCKFEYCPDKDSVDNWEFVVHGKGNRNE